MQSLHCKIRPPPPPPPPILQRRTCCFSSCGMRHADCAAPRGHVCELLCVVWDMALQEGAAEGAAEDGGGGSSAGRQVLPKMTFNKATFAAEGSDQVGVSPFVCACVSPPLPPYPSLVPTPRTELCLSRSIQAPVLYLGLQRARVCFSVLLAGWLHLQKLDMNDPSFWEKVLGPKPAQRLLNDLTQGKLEGAKHDIVEVFITGAPPTPHPPPPFRPCLPAARHPSLLLRG
jgi:hypothetical protein